MNYVRPLTLCSGAVVLFSASCQPKQAGLSLKEVEQIVQSADTLFNENKIEEILALLRPYKVRKICKHGAELISCSDLFVFLTAHKAYLQ